MSFTEWFLIWICDEDAVFEDKTYWYVPVQTHKKKKLGVIWQFRFLFFSFLKTNIFF